MKNRIYALPVFILIFSCSFLSGEEVGRLAINEVSKEDNLISKETSIDLKAGDEIIFWSEMDIQYEGKVDMRFRVSIKKGEEEYGNLEIDPTEKDMTLTEVKNTLDDKTSWSFTGRNAVFNIQADGKYTFKAILVVSENNSLKVSKAELVLKKI